MREIQETGCYSFIVAKNRLVHGDFGHMKTPFELQQVCPILSGRGRVELGAHLKPVTPKQKHAFSMTGKYSATGNFFLLLPHILYFQVCLPIFWKHFFGSPFSEQKSSMLWFCLHVCIFRQGCERKKTLSFYGKMENGTIWTIFCWLQVYDICSVLLHTGKCASSVVDLKQKRPFELFWCTKRS